MSVPLHRARFSALLIYWLLGGASAFAGPAGDGSPTDGNEQQEMLILPVRVVAADGQPVAGAVVNPWALRCSQGHGMWQLKGLGRSEPPTLTTDGEGRATVPFPKFAEPDERVLTTQVTLSIDHPEFAYITFEFIDIPRKETDDHVVTLNRGAPVELLPVQNGKPAALEGLYVTWSDSRSWKPEVSPTVTDDRSLRIPPIAAGAGQTLLVRLKGERATHFSQITDLDLVPGETLKKTVELRPAIRIEGALSDNVPRPVKNGRLIAQTLPRDVEREDVQWSTWAPMAADGTFVIESWPADEAMQIIALCDGYLAESGDAPSVVKNPRVSRRWINDAIFAARALPHRLERAAKTSPNGANLNALAEVARSVTANIYGDPFLRPQVFEATAFGKRLELRMTPAVRCEIETVNEEGAPIAGVTVMSNPNVGWWNHGSQVYCSSFVRGEQLLLKRDYEAARDDSLPKAYHTASDADGRCVLELPVGRESLYAEHDDYELPIVQGRREQKVMLMPGETAHATLVLQAKGAERLGEWDKLAGVLFGCTGEQCRRLLEDDGFRDRMSVVRAQLSAAKNPRDPKVLSGAFATISEAFNELDDQKEAAKWRRKAAEQKAKAERGGGTPATK